MNIEVGVMAEWVKLWGIKHEALSLDPQHLCKSWESWWCKPIISVLRRQRQEDPESLLASQCS